EFRIHCSNAARSGTRITQRVCRPQYADSATRDAGRQFLGALFFECTVGGAAAPSTPFDNEACVHRVSGVAQTAVSEVGLKDRQLANEVQRLAHERSEEHTSELQSRENLVCRLLLEKKKKTAHEER